MGLKLDTTKWKEFEIQDFFDVKLSKGDLKLEFCKKGKFPLVSSGETNNGYIGYISDSNDSNANFFSKNCLTVDMFCNAFYQPFDFYAVSHGRVNVLVPKIKFNKNIGLFICSIINKEKFKYSYGRAVYSYVIKKMLIKLPVLHNNTPDWQYMNDYIEAITNKKRSNGQTLAEYIKTANKHQEQPLNTDTWKMFKLSDLFEIKTGADLIYREQEAGEICVIGHNAENHGVTCKIKLLSNREKYNHSKTISLGDRGNFIAYTQPCDFYIGTRVKALISRNDKVNIYSLMFISTVINKEQYKFSYGRNATDKTPDIEIKLPQTPEGNPDYEYMENYIKTLPYADKI